MVEPGRDARRQTSRRRVRERAAIATALLIVPVAAVLGLKLPLDASGVLAPIFDLPRSAFGHVRSATDGKVQLSDSEPTEYRFARGDHAPFLPPRPQRRHRSHSSSRPETTTPVRHPRGATGEDVAAPGRPIQAPADGATDSPSGDLGDGTPQAPAHGRTGTTPADRQSGGSDRPATSDAPAGAGDSHGGDQSGDPAGPEWRWVVRAMPWSPA